MSDSPHPVAGVVDASLAAHAKASSQSITSLHRWSDSLLTFKMTRPVDYHFKPGQYARIGLSVNGAMIWRPYSMVSAPDDVELEFYSVIVPGGAFTTRLKNLAIGDAISIEKQVYGFLTADRFTDGAILWMLATGTGLGPFISMLRDPALWGQFDDIVVVHGVRSKSEFAYADELDAMSNMPPLNVTSPARLHIVQAVTRESDLAPSQLHGRITDLFDSGTLESATGLSINAETSRVMLCGNPAMIDEMRSKLHGRGMRPCRRALPGQFLTENYW